MRVRTNFCCTPAREIRTRPPTPSGALLRSLRRTSISSRPRGSAVVVVGAGGAGSSIGWITTAPAQSLPRARINPYVSRSGMWMSRAIDWRDSPSGSKPSRNGRTIPCVYRRELTGSESDKRGVPNGYLLSASSVYVNRSRSRSRSMTATRSP